MSCPYSCPLAPSSSNNTRLTMQAGCSHHLQFIISVADLVKFTGYIRIEDLDSLLFQGSSTFTRVSYQVHPCQAYRRQKHLCAVTMLKPNCQAKEGKSFVNDKDQQQPWTPTPTITPTIEPQIRQGTGSSEYHEAISCLW